MTINAVIQRCITTLGPIRNSFDTQPTGNILHCRRSDLLPLHTYIAGVYWVTDESVADAMAAAEKNKRDRQQFAQHRQYNNLR